MSSIPGRSGHREPLITGHVLTRPFAKRFQYGLQRHPITCQRILDPWWDFWVNFALYDVVGLQLAKLLNQHLLGYGRERSPKLPVTMSPFKQGVDDHALPSSPDDTQ